uniref:Uncharacterized protein n=1 Tax=Mus musculus TaxID=10090 RepID=Q9DCF0_MOUSE|nr:unnamed protein product [Mus musculus]
MECWQTQRQTGYVGPFNNQLASVIPELKRMRLEDQEFKTILCYIEFQTNKKATLLTPHPTGNFSSFVSPSPFPLPLFPCPPFPLPPPSAGVSLLARFSSLLSLS